MGFDIKTWTNPITLDATNINRLERGIKDAHDTLDITNQEVANLQNKQGELIKHFNNLNISSTTLTTLETINNLMQTTNILDILNNSSVLLTKTPQSFTTQELNQIYDNLRLNSFLRLTDIKLNNTSIVSGTKVTIPVDNTLNALSDNPISNKAVANALKNVNLSGGSYKLADMIQDSNHMTVTAQEKALWNSGGNGSGGGIATEVDPTVPDWAKQKTKPSYTWDEIDLKPLIPTDTGDLTQNSAGYLTTATTTTLVNNLLDSYTSSTILPINNSIAALDSAQKILQASIENKADTDHTHTSYAEYSHTHTKSQITDFTHTHTKSQITDFTHTHTKSQITDFTHTHPYLPLSGGTMEGPLVLNDGDGTTKGNIQLLETGQITDGSTATLFGRVGSLTNTLIIGHGNYTMQLRGKTARPTYNNNDLALKSDIPTASTIYKGSSSTRTSNTTAVSTLRFANVSGSLYIWTS